MNQTPPRRSMSQALQTASTPEALAFIKEGTPKPKTAHPVLVPDKEAADRPNVAPLPAPEPLEAKTEPGGETKMAEASKVKKARAPKEEKDEALSQVPQGFVSSTYRLPAEIPPALVRASADRKIKKIKPWSHQDIVAEALSQWLKKNGYL